MTEPSYLADSLWSKINPKMNPSERKRYLTRELTANGALLREAQFVLQDHQHLHRLCMNSLPSPFELKEESDYVETSPDSGVLQHYANGSSNAVGVSVVVPHATPDRVPPFWTRLREAPYCLVARGQQFAQTKLGFSRSLDEIWLAGGMAHYLAHPAVPGMTIEEFHAELLALFSTRCGVGAGLNAGENSPPPDGSSNSSSGPSSGPNGPSGNSGSSSGSSSGPSSGPSGPSGSSSSSGPDNGMSSDRGVSGSTSALSIGGSSTASGKTMDAMMIAAAPSSMQPILAALRMHVSQCADVDPTRALVSCMVHETLIQRQLSLDDAMKHEDLCWYLYCAILQTTFSLGEPQSLDELNDFLVGCAEEFGFPSAEVKTDKPGHPASSEPITGGLKYRRYRALQTCSLQSTASSYQKKFSTNTSPLFARACCTELVVPNDAEQFELTVDGQTVTFCGIPNPTVLDLVLDPEDQEAGGTPGPVPEEKGREYHVFLPDEKHASGVVESCVVDSKFVETQLVFEETNGNICVHLPKAAVLKLTGVTACNSYIQNKTRKCRNRTSDKSGFCHVHRASPITQI